MKKSLLSATLAIMLCQVPFSPMLQVAQAESTTYRVTYKMPTVNVLEEGLLYHSILKESLKLKNPNLATIVERNRIDEIELLADLLSADPPRGFFLDQFYASRKGYLISLYNEIGVLDPIYPKGYDPVAIKRQIAQMHPVDNWSERSELRKRRGQTELEARINALIQAGFVKTTELKDEPPTKQFVAETLYRIFKTVRPYKGSVAPLDSQSEAVRWAIEVGLPGFEVDAHGYIYPQSPFPPYKYNETLQFVYLFLPSNINGTGRDYFQFEFEQELLLQQLHNHREDLFYVNNKPLSASDGSFQSRDLTEVKKAETQLSAALALQLPGMLEQARREVLKPRVWDWRKDVIRHPSFAKLVQEYRKTKSQKSVMQVYLALKTHYNLYNRQDSIKVIKNVLDNVK